MAEALIVKLADQPASGVWNEKSNLSFDGNTATIHLAKF